MSNRSFQIVIDALCDESTAFPHRYLPDFSDLSPENVSALMAQWPGISEKRKCTLLGKLVELYDEDTRVSFDALATALISDPDAQIRAQALRLLVNSDDTRLVPRVIQLVENDPDTDVRIRAAAALGSFVELGELDEIPAEARRLVEECLFRAARSENSDVQRAAIEAIGFSTRPEAEALIQSAYTRPEAQWVATALLAMGRSANAHWEELILAKLDDRNIDIRRNAAQAAGELRIEVARQQLLNLLEEEDDSDVFLAAVWSLSQIGGEDVRVVLQTLIDQAEDEEAIVYIEEALANLDFTEELNAFDLLALDPDDEIDSED